MPKIRIVKTPDMGPTISKEMLEKFMNYAEMLEKFMNYARKKKANATRKP